MVQATEGGEMVGEGDGEQAPAPELRYRRAEHPSRAPLVLGGLLVLALVAGGIWFAAGRLSASASAPYAAPASEPAGGSGGAIATSTTSTPTTAVPTTREPTTTFVTTTTAPTTTTTEAPSVGPSGAPEDTWVAMLGSLTSQAGAEQELAKVLAVAPGAQVARSDDIGSLVPGYWIVYVGPIATGEDALDYCRAIGRNDRDQCYAAYFSDDPADRTKRLFPN